MGAAETAGVTSKGVQLPGASRQAWHLEEAHRGGRIGSVALEGRHTASQHPDLRKEDGSSDPRGLPGPAQTARVDLGHLPPCRKFCQEFLLVVTSFHEQTLGPSALTRLPKKRTSQW